MDAIMVGNMKPLRTRNGNREEHPALAVCAKEERLHYFVCFFGVAAFALMCTLSVLKHGSVTGLVWTMFLAFLPLQGALYRTMRRIDCQRMSAIAEQGTRKKMTLIGSSFDSGDNLIVKLANEHGDVFLVKLWNESPPLSPQARRDNPLPQLPDQFLRLPYDADVCLDPKTEEIAGIIVGGKRFWTEPSSYGHCLKRISSIGLLVREPEYRLIPAKTKAIELSAEERERLPEKPAGSGDCET